MSDDDILDGIRQPGRFDETAASKDVGNDLPHVKYADWTRGKKGRGGSWGHIFFPPEDPNPCSYCGVITVTYMFEVYYRPPEDSTREAALAERVSHLGGRLDYCEAPSGGLPGGVCLTFEFPDIDRVRAAAESLRAGRVCRRSCGVR